jgi:cellulase/cellobiase CelA1
LVFVFLGFSSILRTVSTNQSSVSDDVDLLDNANYFLKVFKKNIIEAEISEGGLCGIPDGKFFNTDGQTYIDFIKNDTCYSFELTDNRMMMKIGSESEYITSDNIIIDKLDFLVEDNISLGQPIATINIGMVKKDNENSQISAQTSISLDYKTPVEEEVSVENSEWLSLDYSIRDDDGTYYCADLEIINASSSPIIWDYNLDTTVPPFLLDNLSGTPWNMDYSLDSGILSMSGSETWNETVSANSAVSGFGFCANRTEEWTGEEETEWIVLDYSIRDDNGTSYCADLTISTASTTPIVWDYDLDVSVDPFKVDTVTSYWAMNQTLSAGIMSISGLEYNDEVVSGSPVTGLGFCANRVTSGGETAEVFYDYVIDNDWETGYCATINVTTDSQDPVEWNTEIDLSTYPLNGTPTNLWNADWSFSNSTLYASGLSHNLTVSASAPTDFGFCADR